MAGLWPGVLSAFLLLGSACSTEPSRPNVLVLLVDALRADRLGCYGYERDTSPRIDALASESVLFVNAYAQSPWTKPSIPTLFTSLYPIQHKVYEGEMVGSAGFLESDTLSEELLTLAEAFRDAGFRTAGVVNNTHLPGDHGFAQGFEVYDQASLDAGEINRRFLQFLDRADERPFFAYLHYLDVHWPFQPSAVFRDRFEGSGTSPLFDRDDWSGLRDRINEGAVSVSESDRARLIELYDAAIAELDHRIGELHDALRRRELLDETVILLTSDHGDELLEHGRVGHGGTLFEEVLRIPLMIRLPAAERAIRLESPARLLDIYPTLLGAAGIARPVGLEGRDLLAGSAAVPAEIIAETRHKRTYRISVLRGRWKYIRIYRALGVRRLAPGPPETFGLAPGMRVKVRGVFGPNGSLSARKVSLQDSGDGDIEVSGPVSRVNGRSREFSIYTFRVVPTKKLRGPLAQSILETLEDGEWVKVEGDPTFGETILADKLERLPPGERETKLEGIIQAIQAGPGRTAEARIGNTIVRLSRDTRIKAPGGKSSAATVSSERQDDPFTPERLLSEQGLVTQALLFDLETDPGERRDLGGVTHPRAAELHRDLALWLERMSGYDSRSRAGRKRLDAEEIEQLRELGYLE